jgi:glycosyltransferase involved in cell wall biosynthesis
MTSRPRICFVVESGTDVRLIDGIGAFARLTVVARQIVGGVEISRPPTSDARLLVGPASYSAFARHVWTYLRQHRDAFDFVLAQGYGPAAAAANLAARATQTPTAMLVCSPTEEYYRCRRETSGFGKPFRWRELFALWLLAALNARAGAQFIVISEYLRDVVRSRGARGAVDVVPVYGVDTGVFRPVEMPRREIRRTRGLPDKGVILFFSSRMAPEKDSPVLLAAFARLLAAGRDVYLLHRSGGYLRLLADAADAGVAHRVIASNAVHPLDDLPLDYLASDVCVQASRAEGLGFSVLEAMACGVPVVATRVGGLAETVIDGETGWTCEPRDPAALAGAIAHALDRPDEARRRAAVARQMVVARYEQREVFRRLAGLIEPRIGNPS